MTATDASTTIRYKPVGVTHIVIMAIVALMIVAINYILVALGHATSQADIGYITMGNIVISIANAYWLVRLSVNAQGVTESTVKP
ncbi:MAG: hypothetical protein M1459_01065 [Patescibacteria group bacterium]|nr:hypothetical protein [Patescibacteria group bacterium]